MRNEKGVILIFVLIVLVTFSLLGLGLSFRARIGNKLSQYYIAECKVLNLAESKLNGVMYKIAKDDNNYDGFNEEWARGTSTDLEGGGSVKVTVEDEDGKLNVNIATNQWLDNIYLISEALKNQIIDNRPFFVQEELLCLKSIKYLYSKEDISRILNLLTTHNHDKLNVNTIREKILRAMPGLSRNTVDLVISLRRNEPIDNIEIFKDQGISLSEYQIISEFFKTTSTYYTVKIQVDDKKNKINKSFRIALKKNLESKSVEIIRWLEQ